MRLVMSLLAGLSLMASVGCCLHNTCDCCSDICGSCGGCGGCGGGYYSAPHGVQGAPAPLPAGENIKKMPAPAPAPAGAPEKAPGVGL